MRYLPELLLIAGLVASYFIVRWLDAKPAKIWFACFVGLFIVGHAMNLAAIRANGHRMPVVTEHINWDDAPNLHLPVIVTEAFVHSLKKAQKAVTQVDEIHENLTESKVRLMFFADRYPLKYNDEARAVYSVGDVFIALGISILLFGAIPIWIAARRRKKLNASS